MKNIQFNPSGIEFLRNYDINNGTDIINMNEMIEDQLSIMLQIAEKLPEPHKSELLRHIYFTFTLHGQLKKQINSKLFSSIEDLIFEIEEQKAS